MNLTMSGGALASASVKTIYAAVCKAVRKTAMANAISTSSTSGVNVGSSVSISVNPGQGVRTRLYCRCLPTNAPHSRGSGVAFGWRHTLYQRMACACLPQARPFRPRRD